MIRRNNIKKESNINNNRGVGSCSTPTNSGTWGRSAALAIPLRKSHPYEIHSKLTCRVESVLMAMFNYLSHWNDFGDIGAGFFYIKGIPRHHVLVDTGCEATRYLSDGFKAKQVASTEERLAEEGLTPDDIDTVIVTHLHGDHVENLHLFKNAKVTVQASELTGAYNPPFHTAAFYVPEYWEDANLAVVDGNVELFPGVWVLHTPGHSAGGQSVLVDAEGGRYIIFGMCCVKANIEEGNVPTIHGHGADVITVHDTMKKLHGMADTIITVHDVESFGKVYK